MRKKYELLINNINEGKYTGREIILSGAVLFLTGALLGMIFSPRKNQVIGSHNGNGSCNGNEAKAGDKKEKKGKINLNWELYMAVVQPYNPPANNTFRGQP